MKRVDLSKLGEIIKKYFPFSVAIFTLFFGLGFLFATQYPDLAQEGMRELQGAFSYLFDLDPVWMALFIFFNNSIKILLFMLFGVLFALPTLFFLVVNGWVLGYVSGTVYPSIGLSGLFFSLFFHGIFELTALFIGTSIGFWIGYSLFKELRKGEKKIKEKVSLAVNTFVYIILPLLGVAAVIETYKIFFS